MIVEICVVSPSGMNAQRFRASLEKTDISKIPAFIDDDETFLLDYIERVAQNANLFFARVNDMDVGVCALYANRPMLAHITFLGVIPQYSGKGIGGQLVSEAIAYARKKKFTEITIETDINNSEALRLYKKNGFSIISSTGQAVHLSQSLNPKND